jgi:hypothetical protein
MAKISGQPSELSKVLRPRRDKRISAWRCHLPLHEGKLKLRIQALKPADSCPFPFRNLNRRRCEQYGSVAEPRGVRMVTIHAGASGTQRRPGHASVPHSRCESNSPSDMNTSHREYESDDNGRPSLRHSALCCRCSGLQSCVIGTAEKKRHRACLMLEGIGRLMRRESKVRN